MSMVIDGAWVGSNGERRTLVFVNLGTNEYFHGIPNCIYSYVDIALWVPKRKQVLHKEMTQW